jgi:hypothetical protein
MADQSEKAEKVIALNVKLTPVDHADQPVSVNYTTVGVAQGIVYLDFGFVEPRLLATVARAAQGGQPLPKNLEGKLVTRVAMGLDVLQRLHQQLGQVLSGLRGTKSGKS